MDENNSIYKNPGETLRKFYKRNYKYLNTEAREFLEAKGKFDSENSDIIKDMSDSEYEDFLKSDYSRWLNSESDYLSDFNKNRQERKNKNNFTSESEFED